MRVRILHVMRAYRFSTVSSRLSSVQVFSHGSHFPFACLQIFALLIRAAAALTGGVRAKILPGPRGFHGCMLVGQSATLSLVDRIQRLLAIYRLWLHELRGRLDQAFIAVARLRSQGRDFQEIRAEVARTIFNFNSRLQAVEDEVESTLESQAAVLGAFELRLQRVQLAVLLLCILILQLLRLLL